MIIRTLLLAAALAWVVFPAPAADPAVRLITLDPGHFHASLVQKLMYPQVNPLVHVYALDGPDLQAHLKRINDFNTRALNPTHWEEQVYTGPDFLERMVAERAGTVVVISGNNARKTEYIDRAVEAGFNVLADKPMAITPDGFDRLRRIFSTAAARKVLLYDIMTERSEVTTFLQRELARVPQVFGVLEKGTPSAPAVEMESVHHFFKEVNGKPLTRPAWSFDVRQQGEAIPDVGTHLVNLVQWECFPDQILDWQKDIQVHAARRWPTSLTPDQFKRATGLDDYPSFLKPEVGSDHVLKVFQNGEVSYTLRGVWVKAAVLWRFQAPEGAKDTHNSLLRGTRANLRVRQSAEQHWGSVLYVENRSQTSAVEFERDLRAAVAKLAVDWPGLGVKASGNAWQVVIPDKYNLGHEAHFAQVTERYLRYLAAGKLPDWEVPNMLAKYLYHHPAYALGHRSE